MISQSGDENAPGAVVDEETRARVTEAPTLDETTDESSSVPTAEPTARSDGDFSSGDADTGEGDGGQAETAPPADPVP